MNFPKEDSIAQFNLLGQLSDPKAESDYQKSQFPATLKRMRFVCAITASAYLAAIYADSYQLSGNDFLTLAGCRILVAMTGVFSLLYTFKKNATPAGLGIATGVYMSLLMLTESYELVLKTSHIPVHETPITVFIALLYYLYLTPQIWQPLIASGLGSIVYLLTLAFLTNISTDYLSNTILIFGLANGFGLYFCIRFGTAQRREYLALSELRHRADIDGLTGICNRRHVMELSSREFNAAKRYGHPCAILMLDIDHFKNINDTYGHAVGDIVLTGLTNKCSESLREVDLFGRLGGEEFVILMPHCTCNQASLVAQRLLDTIRKMSFESNGHNISITASIGVAELDNTTSTLDSLLNAADTALYRAKQNGRDQVSEHFTAAPTFKTS